MCSASSIERGGLEGKLAPASGELFLASRGGARLPCQLCFERHALRVASAGARAASGESLLVISYPNLLRWFPLGADRGSLALVFLSQGTFVRDSECVFDAAPASGGGGANQKPQPAVRIETISRSAAQQLSDNLMQVCAAYAPLYKIRQAKALEITRMQIRSLREAQQDNTAHAKGKLAALERVERDQALRRVAAVRQQRSMGKGSSSGGANSGDGLGGKAGPQRVRSRSMAAAPTSPLDMGADELGRYDTHLGRRRSRGASIVNGLVNGVASLFGRQRLVDDEAIRQSDEAETRAMEARHTQALQVYEPPPPRPPPPPCVPDKRVTDGGIADEGIHRDDGECEPDLFQGLALVPTPAPGQRRHTNPFLTPPPGSITGTGSSRGSSSAPAAGAPGGNPFKLPGAPPAPASRATMAPAAGTTTGGHLLDM